MKLTAKDIYSGNTFTRGSYDSMLNNMIRQANYHAGKKFEIYDEDLDRTFKFDTKYVEHSEYESDLIEAFGSREDYEFFMNMKKYEVWQCAYEDTQYIPVRIELHTIDWDKYIIVNGINNAIKFVETLSDLRPFRGSICIHSDNGEYSYFSVAAFPRDVYGCPTFVKYSDKNKLFDMAAKEHEFETRLVDTKYGKRSRRYDEYYVSGF